MEGSTVHHISTLVFKLEILVLHCTHIGFKERTKFWLPINICDLYCSVINLQ